MLRAEMKNLPAMRTYTLPPYAYKGTEMLYVSSKASTKAAASFPCFSCRTVVGNSTFACSACQPMQHFLVANERLRTMQPINDFSELSMYDVCSAFASNEAPSTTRS